MKIITAICISHIFLSFAYSHPGGLKKSGSLKGCHNDKKKGEFHCHRGSYASKAWKSEEEALKGFSNIQIVPVNTTVKIKSGSKYVRKDWMYGLDYESDCQDTRAEILIKRSTKPIVFRGSRKCRVDRGEWEDFYYPEKVTEASKIQIDHVVPLKNAHIYGGANWTSDKKRLFANDPENLVITTIKTNAQKSAHGIESWVPVNKTYACRYLKRWIEIKMKYGLIIPEIERKAVDSRSCENTALVR